MSKPAGDPIAVTLVEKASFDSLCGAAFNGYCVLSDGSHVSATQYFRTLGMTYEGVPIIIVNGFDAPLVFPGSTYLKHCYQANYPTESNLVGAFDDPPLIPLGNWTPHAAKGYEFHLAIPSPVGAVIAKGFLPMVQGLAPPGGNN